MEWQGTGFPSVGGSPWWPSPPLYEEAVKQAEAAHFLHCPVFLRARCVLQEGLLKSTGFLVSLAPVSSSVLDRLLQLLGTVSVEGC